MLVGGLVQGQHAPRSPCSARLLLLVLLPAIITMAVIKCPIAEDDYKPLYYRQRQRKEAGVGGWGGVVVKAASWICPSSGT